MIEDLSKIKAARNLVSIRREGIDNRRIQGLLIDYSDELILIQYVFDFIYDGQMVLRRSDVSSIESDKTDLLQTQILIDEGIYSNIECELECDLKSWSTAISTLASQCRFAIIEDENSDPPSLYLGQVKNIGPESVSILEFSGAANWRDETSEVHYEDINCLQLNNNYIKVYERYFDRNPAKNANFSSKS